MESIFVDLDANSYYINIGENILGNIEKYIGHRDKIMVITDRNVDDLYGSILLDSLIGEAYKYIVEPGETSKTISTVEGILEEMVSLNFTRNSKIIALGGGVVGDIAGFAASIYMRGIGFISIPTTLLSSVDSSVGGKTGVNLPNGKNMVGSFHQPESVLIDLKLLETLSKRELVSGLGEIIKYGIIEDYEFLKNTSKDLKSILALKKETLKDVILRSCQVKSKIVSEDEKEVGIRKILNHGHTIGHALEAGTGYKRYTHGEAVLIGIYYESRMAKEMGLISYNYFKEIENIIKSVGVDLDISDFSREKLVENMMRDKKNKKGKISFILPIGKGKVEEVLLDRSEVKW